MSTIDRTPDTMAMVSGTPIPGSDSDATDSSMGTAKSPNKTGSRPSSVKLAGTDSEELPGPRTASNTTTMSTLGTVAAPRKTPASSPTREIVS